METNKPHHIENESDYKALAVNKGIKQPPSVNEESVSRFLNKKRNILTANEYVDGILGGNITLLSKAVTLVESSKPAHQ
jgi:LAO/AO transport system kinase